METVILIFMVAVFVMQTISTVLLMFLVLDIVLRRRNAAERKADESVDDAMQESRSRSRAFNEGLENLMKFSVNGDTGIPGGDTL